MILITEFFKMWKIRKYILLIYYYTIHCILILLNKVQILSEYRTDIFNNIKLSEIFQLIMQRM
jgi:hypothetical protein